MLKNIKIKIMDNTRRIENFQLNEETNEIILNVREINNTILTSLPPRKTPDVIKIERYGVVNGVITLIECKTGKEITVPASTEVVWDDNTETPTE